MASITKRGDTFRIMVSCGYGMDGRQIRRTTTFSPPPDVTEGKALKLAQAFAHDYEKHVNGVSNLNESMRFHELAEWYFREIGPNKLKENTLIGTQKLIDIYVIPYIGHLKLKDIGTARLDELFNRLRVSGRVLKTYTLKDKTAIPYGSCKPLARLTGLSDATIYAAYHGVQIWEDSAVRIAEAAGKKLNEVFEQTSKESGLDAGTVTRIRTALSSIFSTAVRKEIVTKNPVTNTTPPKKEQKEKPYLDDSQCRRLLSILDEHENPQLRVMITTLLYTGFRSGELCGLRWSDVDLEHGVIFVRHTLYRDRQGQHKLSTPKTKASERAVRIPGDLVDMLVAHKQWQDERRAALGGLWTDTNAVFTAETGKWHSRTYLNAMFKRLLAENDLPDVHIHDLRHACASLLINQGVPVKVISEHLGHSCTRTTEEFYSHIFAATRAKASEALSFALKGE